MRDAAYRGPTEAEWAQVQAWLASWRSRGLASDRELARLAKLTPARLETLAHLLEPPLLEEGPLPMADEDAPLLEEVIAEGDRLFQEGRALLAELGALVSVEVPTPEPRPKEDPMPDLKALPSPPPHPKGEPLKPAECQRLRAYARSAMALGKLLGLSDSTAGRALKGLPISAEVAEKMRELLTREPPETPAGRARGPAKKPAPRSPKIRPESGLSHRKPEAREEVQAPAAPKEAGRVTFGGSFAPAPAPAPASPPGVLDRLLSLTESLVALYREERRGDGR